MNLSEANGFSLRKFQNSTLSMAVFSRYISATGRNIVSSSIRASGNLLRNAHNAGEAISASPIPDKANTKIERGIICGVAAVFDIFCGEVKV